MLHTANKSWQYCRQHCIQLINIHCQKSAVTLGGGLRHKVSSRHNGLCPFLSLKIMWRLYKKDLPDLKLWYQGYLFPMWSLENSIYSVLVGGVPASILQSDGVSATPGQKGGVLNRAASPLSHALFPPSYFPDVNQPFPFWFYENVQSTCPKSGFTSDPNDFTLQSNNFMPN